MDGSFETVFSGFIIVPAALGGPFCLYQKLHLGTFEYFEYTNLYADLWVGLNTHSNCFWYLLDHRDYSGTDDDGW
jgi:hypothetical protein